MTILFLNAREEDSMSPLKIKLFTHTDFDGIGCAVVGKRAFGDNIQVEYCGYKEIDEKVIDFLKNEEEVDIMFITDISVNERTAKIIDATFGDKVQLLDHHKTANWLNAYGWAKVQETESWMPAGLEREQEVIASGTSLFYAFLMDNGLINDSNPDLWDFVEHVRLYDSWDWTRKGLIHPKHMNDLLTLIGRYDMVDRFVTNPSIDLTHTERKLIEVENKRIDRYIKSKEKELTVHNWEGYTVGVVFAENYHSEVGNRLAENHHELDFIVMINPANSAKSYRGIKTGIDLGLIAKKYGGGGHPPASGSPLGESTKLEMIGLALSLNSVK